MLDGISITTTGGPVMSALLVMLLAAPAVTAAVALAVGRRRPRLAGRLGAVHCGVRDSSDRRCWPSDAAGDVASRRCNTAGDHSILAVRADQVAVVLLLLVFGVSAIVQTFAMRYLAEDERAGWFAPEPACSPAAPPS